jgi:MoxR-like ATPase
VTSSHEEVARGLRERANYLAGRGLATIIAVALALRKPLLLEGEAGVGKTESAKALAALLDARLIRIQCYEGIDVAHALYDWNYARQMLYIQTLRGGEGMQDEAIRDVFGPDFLLRRPLLDAIDNTDPTPPVLLIDEIDRADNEFEAFLLELLSDFQVTIPEIGSIRAERPPTVVLTSNRTRELHDALKRRCLYHWIGYPTPEEEMEIIRLRAPEVPERLARQAVALIAGLRRIELWKAPGVAETLAWVRSLLALGEDELSSELVDSTLGVVLKHQEDIDHVRDRDTRELVANAERRAAEIAVD